MTKSFSKEAYEERIGRLFQRFPSFGGIGAGAYKPGLEHIRKACAFLGNPQESYPCVHVAGTNGKGSVSNMLAASLSSRGMKVGLYTSPHILDFRERMRLVSPGGVELISREEVWSFLDRFDAISEEEDLSFFEITTAMAFDFFASQKVDIAVIETGLGGRLDATNIILPRLSVITNIGYDHTDLLGNTLEQIAVEKAGIIKPGIPVVVGESSSETDGVFIRAAASAGSPLYFADRDTIPFPCVAEGVFPVDAAANYDPCSAELIYGRISDKMDLRGIYQRKNLRTALCALSLLGISPSDETLCAVASICGFRARWEVLSRNPLTICDIGHNEHGLRYNFAQLESMLDKGECGSLVMVYGSVSDKDVDAVLRIIPERAELFFTAAQSKRAMPAEELYRRAGRPGARVCPEVAGAVSKALERCTSLDRPVLYIGGSTYVVSEALAYLEKIK